MLSEFHQYNLNRKKSHLIALQKMIIFFLIIILNSQSSENIKQIFQIRDYMTVKVFKEILLEHKNKPNSNFIAKTILNVCFDDFKEKMLSLNADDIYSHIFNEIFLSYVEVNSEFCPVNSYAKFMKSLFHIQIDEAQFSKITAEGGNILHSLCQSVIILIFFSYKIKKNIVYSPVGFIENLIIDHVAKTKEQFGDEHTSLFRKDDFGNVVLKYFFFSFGNYSFITSFLAPLRMRMSDFDKEFLNKNENEKINIKPFSDFFDEFMKGIRLNLPYLLKLILKLIDIEVKAEFTIEKDNYAPLFTVLIFNFFINPKMQDIYNIDIAKNKSMRYINRIIRNICFKAKFGPSDKCNVFNDIIEDMNKKLNEMIKQIVIEEIDVSDKQKVDNMIKGRNSDVDIDMPLFLYGNDWKVVSAAFKLNNEGINIFTVD